MKQCYKVLLNEATANHSDRLDTVLNAAGHKPEIFKGSIQDLKKQTLQYQPDCIIIRLPSPDQALFDEIMATAAETPTPLILFSENGDRTIIQRAIAAGVSAYIVEDSTEISIRRIQSILDVAIARFNEYQALKDELNRTKTTLQERKMIEQAKGVLMQTRSCTEAEAYKLLRSTAMENNQRMITVAEQLINAQRLLYR